MCRRGKETILEHNCLDTFSAESFVPLLQFSPKKLSEETFRKSATVTNLRSAVYPMMHNESELKQAITLSRTCKLEALCDRRHT